MGELQKYNTEELTRFNEFMAAVLKPGVLDVKTKELIALGTAIITRCVYCIGPRVEKSYKAGAATAEIMEAGAAAILMGGGPALAYIAEAKRAAGLFRDKYEK